MEVISIKDILSCEEFPIVLKRSYGIDSFIMGYHVYKTNWTPVVGEKLTGVMESNNWWINMPLLLEVMRV